MGTRVRSSIVLLAFVVCVCSASARVIGAQAPARQPSVTTDVVYGHKDGLALTLDVHRSAHPNGAGVISIVSGGWQSSVELAQIFTQAYPVHREGVHRLRRETRQLAEISHVGDRGGHAAVGPLHPSAREGVRCRSRPPWRVRR
jgi:hypothetical protein